MSQRRQHSQRSSVAKPSVSDLQIIIQGDPIQSAYVTNTWAQQLGTGLARAGLTTAQIRNIFGHVRQIEMNWPPGETETARAQSAQRELLLLQPKLAYQARREAERHKPALGELAEVLTTAIGYVQGSRENFQRFVDFFEATLAYHKAAGGN